MRIKHLPFLFAIDFNEIFSDPPPKKKTQQQQQTNKKPPIDTITRLQVRQMAVIAAQITSYSTVCSRAPSGDNKETNKAEVNPSETGGWWLGNLFHVMASSMFKAWYASRKYKNHRDKVKWTSMITQNVKQLGETIYIYIYIYINTLIYKQSILRLHNTD